MSSLNDFSLGHSVTKCQNVSFSSPHSLQKGLIVGLALNFLQLRQLNPVIIDISLVRCDLYMFKIFLLCFCLGH